MKLVYILATLFLATATAFAQTDAAGEPVSEALAGLIPFAIIMGFLFWFIRRSSRRTAPYMDRGMLHMERLEKQNETIIALLTELTGKKSISEQPPPLYRDPADARPESEA